MKESLVSAEAWIYCIKNLKIVKGYSVIIRRTVNTMAKKKTRKRKIVVNNYFVKGHHLYSGTNKNWHASSCIAGRDDSTYIDSIYLTPTLTIVNKHTVEFCFILV